MMDIKSLRREIEQIDTIPTIPSALQKLLKVIENPKAQLNEISDCILSDPVLTTRVLKMINSPIYGFPGRISSLTQALILLGLNVVRGMLLGVSVFDAMEKAMRGLWKHSMGCAVVARIVAKKSGVSEPEEVAVAALLHDIGKVILSLKFPDEYARVMKETESSEKFIVEVEKEIFTITHAEAGAWIARKWNFPRNLVESIAYHHKPHLSKNAPLQSAIVHFSDIILRARGYGFGGDIFVPNIHPVAWKTLNLDADDIKGILNDIEEPLEMAGEELLSDE